MARSAGVRSANTDVDSGGAEGQVAAGLGATNVRRLPTDINNQGLNQMTESQSPLPVSRSKSCSVARDRQRNGVWGSSNPSE